MTTLKSDEPDEVWTCKDGRKINVGDLELDHAQNIIRLLIRRHRKQLPLLKLRIGAYKREMSRIREDEFFRQRLEFNDGIAGDSLSDLDAISDRDFHDSIINDDPAFEKSV